jgi:hypothetical protein
MKQGILILSGLICLMSLTDCTLVPSPRTAKLADCTGLEVRFTRTVNAGSHFQMVLGVPLSAQVPPYFKGDLIISKAGAQIGEYPIGSDDMQECNWLHNAPELQGFILTWRHTSSPTGLDSFLQTGGAYDFVVKFSEMPPAGSSLWLSWLQ